MLGDIRIALRSFRQQPGVAALAMVIVALGAGANASVFSVIRAVLLEAPSYDAPERLVSIIPSNFISNGDLDFLRARAHSFSQVASSSPGWTMSLLGAGEPLRVTATKTSANLFETLGVRPFLGRTFQLDEDLPGRTPVAILSHRLWRMHLHGDPGVIGRVVTLEGAPHEIIGVMPADFEFLDREAELWTPLVFDRSSPFWKGTTSRGLGRLREGVDVDAARRDLKAIAADWQRELGYQDDWAERLELLPLQEVIVGDVRSPLLVLLGSVGLIVLLAATNVGTLMLGRHVGRRREMAVRAALGASTWRLVRQTTIESLILAASGAAAGVAAARLSLPAFLAIMPPEMPRRAAVAVDPAVLAVVVAVSIASVLACGVLPSLLAMRPSVQPLLRLGAQTETRSGRRTFDALVVAQLTLAIVLGAGALLMLRSLLALQRVHPGFEPLQVLTLKLQPSGERVTGIDRAVDYYDALAAQIAAVPSVERVGATNHLPLSGYNWTTTVTLDERPLLPGVSPTPVSWRIVQGPYFETLRIPLRAGRAFTNYDTRTGAPVAVVNEAFAAQFFGSAESAIGRTIRTRSAGADQTPEIVGVIGNIRHRALSRTPVAELYRPFTQGPLVPLAFVVRASGSPATLSNAVRQAVRSIDPDVPIADMLTLRGLLLESLGRPRLIARLLLAFAGLGLAVVLTGVYGVVAYSVRSRERELGIRLALGARPLSVAALIVRQGGIYAAISLAVGLPIALAAMRLIRGMLFGVQPGDLLSFAALCAIIVLTTAGATIVPALNSTRLNASQALRSDR